MLKTLHGCTSTLGHQLYYYSVDRGGGLEQLTGPTPQSCSEFPSAREQAPTLTAGHVKLCAGTSGANEGHGAGRARSARFLDPGLPRAADLFPSHVSSASAIHSATPTQKKTHPKYRQCAPTASFPQLKSVVKLHLYTVNRRMRLFQGLLKRWCLVVEGCPCADNRFA